MIVKCNDNNGLGELASNLHQTCIKFDATQVIRCKDCKWWVAKRNECIEWYDSPYAPADGYCFRAERKEE